MTNEQLDRLEEIANEIAIAWVMAHQSDGGENGPLARSMIVEGARRWAHETGAEGDVRAAAEAYMASAVRRAYSEQGMDEWNA